MPVDEKPKKSANDESNPERPAQAISTPTFYHLYHCLDAKCIEAKNPVPGSFHQRGVHVKTEKALKVKCPGCGNAMQLATYQHTEGAMIRNPEGASVKNESGKSLFSVVYYGKEYRVAEGDPIIYQAIGQESVNQTADLEKEWM